MKRKLILLLLLILSISSLSFSQDITFKEHSTYGNLLKDLGIITGTNKGLEEEKTLTRQELVAIINKIYPDQDAYKSFVPPTKASFSDVPTTHWAFKEVEFAKAKGITSGIGNGKFGLDQEITNNQAAAFIANSLGFGNFDGEMSYESAYWYLNNTMGIGIDREMNEVESITRGEVFQMIAKALYSDNAEGNQRIRELGYSEKTINAYEYALYVTHAYTYFSLPEATSLKGADILSHTMTLDKNNFSVSDTLYNSFTEEIQGLVDVIILDYQYYLDVNQKYVSNQNFSRLQRYDYTSTPLNDVEFPVIESTGIFNYEGDYFGLEVDASSSHIFVEDFPTLSFLLESTEGTAESDRSISEIYVSYGDGFETYLMVYLTSEKNQYGYMVSVLDDNDNVIAYYTNDDYGYYRLR
ncbi:MAG: hypothetical protein BGO41_02500 [Clostridiales bacterium 38-18]|nr:MAG: hypothetical protein BGO41_02500 [Clostridiales bacterium 38-18]